MSTYAPTQAPAPLDDNLASVESRWPEVAARLRKAHSDGAYQPEPLVARAAAPLPEGALAIVFGVSELWHLDTLLTSGTAPVLLYEPDPGRMLAAFEAMDLRPTLEQPRLTLADTPQGLDAWLQPWLDDAPQVEIFVSPGNQQTRRAELDALVDHLGYCTRREAHDRQVIRRRAGEWTLATLSNLDAFAHAPPIEALRGTLRDRWVVVAGAGPSLDRALDSLKALEGRAALFCVDMALKPLREAGLAPDLVFSIESNPVCRHFVSDGLLDGCGALVVSNRVSRGVFDAAAIPRLLAPIGGDLLAAELAERTGRDSYGVGFTVGTLAVTVAQLAGARGVVLVGQDLAYVDGRSYAAGAPRQGLRVESTGVDGRVAVHVDDPELATVREAGAAAEIDELRRLGDAGALPFIRCVDGRERPTCHAYALTASWLQSWAQGDGAALQRINASGGAQLAGFENCAPAELLARIEDSPGAASSALREALSAATAPPSASGALEAWIAETHASAVALEDTAARAHRACEVLLHRPRDERRLREVSEARGFVATLFEGSDLWAWRFAGELHALETAAERELQPLQGVAEFFAAVAKGADRIALILRPHLRR